MDLTWQPSVPIIYTNTSVMTTKIFPNGVRQMEISKPTKIGQKSSSLRGHIVLVAKFDFDAESEGELSIKKGDVLKLLDRLPNGWVNVESIDKIAASGLVPSLYVDIAANDASHPITVLWLHETKKDKTLEPQNTFNDIQVQMLLKTNSPLTINNRPYPLTASVVCYLVCRDYYWYRVDVTYSTGEHGYLCRFYLDFFDLHAALLDYVAASDAAQLSLSNSKKSTLSSTESGEVDQPSFKLPRLPEPIMAQGQNSTALTELFTKRCKELSTYLNILIADKRLQVCSILLDWLEPDYNEQPGFVVEKILNDSTETISQQIVPESKIIATQLNTQPPKSSELNKVADASCYSALPKGVLRTKSLNHHQNLSNHPVHSSPLINRSASVRVPEPPSRPEGLSRTRTINVADSLSTNQGTEGTFEPPPLPLMPRSLSPKTPPRTVFSPPSRVPSRSMSQSKGSPKVQPAPNASANSSPLVKSVGNVEAEPESAFTPKLVSSESSPWVPKTPTNHQLIRCEVKTPANDVIIIKFKQAEITSVYVFKALLSRKVRFNNVYIKFATTESYEELEPLDQEIFCQLKQASIVYILLT